jgi:hypothetical protein
MTTTGIGRITRTSQRAARGGAAGICLAIALGGCIFLDWSVGSSSSAGVGGGGNDGGGGGSPPVACSAGDPCNDGNDCTDDACDVMKGVCVHTPRASGTACTTHGGTRCDGNGACVGGGVVWSRKFGTAGTPGGVAVDASGDLTITGQAQAPIDFGGGPKGTGTNDLYLASFGPDGTYAWANVYGNTVDVLQGQALAYDAQGNLVVIGRFSGSQPVDLGLGSVPSAGTYTELVIAKYSAKGSAFSTPAFGGGTSIYAQTIAADAQNNAYVAGYFFSGNITFGGMWLPAAGPSTMFVVSLDTSEKHRWSLAATGSGVAIGDPVVTVDPAGGALVAGGFYGSFAFGGQSFMTASSTQYALFVARLGAADGMTVWSTTFEGTMNSGNVAPTSIASDPSSDILIAGWLGTPVNFGGGIINPPGNFVVKLHKTGDHVFSHPLGSDGTPYPCFVAATKTGDVVVAGSFKNAIDLGDGSMVGTQGGTDIYVIKYDAGGTLLWKQTFGDASDQLVTGLALGPAGEVYITGSDHGSVDFGGAIAIDGGTMGQIFLVKLAP